MSFALGLALQLLGPIPLAALVAAGFTSTLYFIDKGD